MSLYLERYIAQANKTEITDDLVKTVSEVSNKLLGRYLHRAIDDVNAKARATMVGGTPAQKKAFYKKNDAKADQRMANVNLAVNKMKANDAKLAKEEYGEDFSDDELARLEAILAKEN